MTHAVIYNIM